MSDQEHLQMPPERPLDNTNCPYCGARLTPKTAKKEHVIGRRFVPRGALKRSWNLILWSCDACNGDKSDLEDDISAISLYHAGVASLMTRQERGEELMTEARRKSAQSFSRRTKKVVADSTESFQGGGTVVPGVEVSFKLLAPPQVDDERVMRLAQFQLMGFFYLLTYDPSARTGYYWPGGFFPVAVTSVRDWGNPVQKWFMGLVFTWRSRVIGTLAEGYYKVVIRQHPSEVLWSWAVEWNTAIRAVGFFGNEQAARALIEQKPAMPVHVVSQQGDHFLRMRLETPLMDSDDLLFRRDVPTQ